MLYRRFGYLHARLLLRSRAQVPGPEGQHRSHDGNDDFEMELMVDASSQKRKELLHLIQQKLSEYG